MQTNTSATLTNTQPALQAPAFKPRTRRHVLSPSEQFQRDLSRKQWLEQLVHWLEDLENGGYIQ